MQDHHLEMVIYLRQAEHRQLRRLLEKPTPRRNTKRITGNMQSVGMLGSVPTRSRRRKQTEEMSLMKLLLLSGGIPYSGVHRLSFGAPETSGMSYREKAEKLTKYQRNPEYCGVYSVPFSGLAHYCQISRDTVYSAQRGEFISGDVAGKLAKGIADYESRRVIFPECRGGKSGSGSMFPYIPLTPPRPLPHIPKLSEESAWTIFSCCVSCGNKIFFPLTIDNKPWVACYHCINPDQYGSFGATPRELNELAKTATYRKLMNDYIYNF